MGWLNDAGVERVLDVTGEDVQAGADIAVLVGGAQVDERVDAVETSVLGEGARDDLQRVGERLDSELFAAFDAVGVVAEPAGDFDFRCAAATEDAAVGNRGRDDIERVRDAAFEFVDDVVGRTTEQERDAVGSVAAALDVEQAFGVVAGDRAVT